MWVMTNPTNSSAITANPTFGTYQAYQNWIWDAEHAVAGKCSGTGCSEIGNSCLTTSNCSSSGTQKLLAYTCSSAPTAAPEPASFFLIGCGLLFASFIGRRRANQTSND